MLNLTKTETRALFILTVVLIISIIIQWLQPHQLNSRFFDYSLQDSLFKVYSADTLSPPQNQKKMAPPKQTPKYVKHKKKKLMFNTININAAGQNELERLPRIGPATAKKILELRQKMNGFAKIEDLLKVKGIGPKTLKKIRPFIFIKADSSVKK